MKFFLIRDDDVNFFTRREMLEAVYGFIFEQDIPINFSVIPAVNASAKTESPHFGAGSPEPFLPPEAVGEDRRSPITGNHELLQFLNSIRRKEFLLHGFEHAGSGGGYEFELDDERVIAGKLDQGTEIFKAAFGALPETFVAPQDKYSLSALEQIRRRFKTFSLGWINAGRIPYAMYWKYLQMKLLRRNYLRSGSLLALEHPGCMFSKFMDSKAMMQRLNDYIARYQFIVLVVHHWEFFNGGVLNRPLLDAFRARIAALREQHEFLTFSELRRKLPE